MLWVLNWDGSFENLKQMLKLMEKKIFITLHSKLSFISSIAKWYSWMYSPKTPYSGHPKEYRFPLISLIKLCSAPQASFLIGGPL